MQQRDGPIFASAEVETFWRYISSSLNRMMAALDTLPPELLNWRPPAHGTNSIFVLANHTLSNARVNLIGTPCESRFERDREGELQVRADERGVDALNWPVLRAELEGALSGLTDTALDAEYSHHWRGDISGRELLIIVARHAAEHLGQVELTRDMAIAALDDPNRPLVGGEPASA